MNEETEFKMLEYKNISEFLDIAKNPVVKLIVCLVLPKFGAFISDTTIQALDKKKGEKD